MSDITHAEAVAAALSPDEQEELLAWLSHRVKQNGKSRESHSVLDIPPVSLGDVLRSVPVDEEDPLG